MGRRGRPPYPDILTPREWEVLALLRENLTNEAIAARLGVKHAAAKYHVSEILSKLGVASREEAAAWEPEAERRPWWAAGAAWLRPVTLGKAALVGASLVVMAGMGVLAWGVLRTSGGETALVVVTSPTAATPEAATTTVAAEATASPAATSSPGPTVGPGFDVVPSVVVANIMDGSEVVLAEQGEDPQWSPNGEWIAYLGGTFGGLGFSASVHIVRPDGSETRSFPSKVEGSDVVGYQCANQLYAWSPSGDSLYFCSGGGLFNVAVDGLTPPQYLFDAHSFSVAPDGERITYWTGRGLGLTPTGAIRIRNLQTGADEHLVDGSWPVWSANGSYIAYFSDLGLYAIDLRDGTVGLLDEDSTGRIPWHSVSWSPSGSQVAYSKGGQIYIADLSSQGPPRLVTAGYGPVWSPDGQALTYEMGFSCEDVYVTSVDGSTSPQRIGDGYGSAWSPDGTRITWARPSFYLSCEPITQ